MFPLRDEHNDAFRKVAREEFPNHIAGLLTEQGNEVDHDPQQRLIVATDKRGYQTRFHFDETGRVERTVSPEGVEAKLQFDDEGRIIGQDLPAAQFRIKRDAAGHIAEVGTSDEVRYKFGRDQQDRVNSIEYPDQKSIEIDFDPVANYPVRIRDRSGQETHFEYRGDGSTTTDALGRKTILRAENGRLHEIRFPDGSKQSYDISDDLKVLSITRRDGSVVRQENDEATNSLIIHWPDGQTTLLHRNEQGQLAFGENDISDVISEYDDAGNVVSEETPAGTVLFESDELQQTTKTTLPSGSEYHFQYDGDNQLASIEAWGDQRVSMQYGADGLPASIQFPNGVTQAIKVTSFGRMAGSVLTNAAGQTLESASYAYDVCEKLIGLDESWATDRAAQTRETRRSIRFKYDDDFRVVSATDATSKQVVESYEYDLKGNLISSGGTPSPVGLMDQPLQSGGHEIKYDGLGNMVQLPGEHGTILVSWAACGVIDKTIVAGRETTYQYDPFGRRIEKSSGDESWKYGWADRQLLWEEHQESPDGPIVRREYLYAPGSFTPIGFREGDDVFWMHSDTRGAVTSVTDQHGNLVWRATYDSFGTATVHIENVRQPFRLAGQYYDEETGLHYSQARYYSPRVKSYLSIDAQWHKRTTTNYSYVRNDPWNLQDPVGTEPATITVGGVLSVLAAGAAVVGIGAGIGAGMAYMFGDDPYAGAVEGGCAALGGFIGLLGGPVGVFVGGLIGGIIGVGLGTLVRAYNRGTPMTLECLWWELLSGVAIEVVVTLVTLGLSKIPGVKPLMKALGDYIDDAFRAVKSKLGALAKSAGQSARGLFRRAMATGGIRGDHIEALIAYAQKHNRIVIFRKPNPNSLKYQGNPNYAPKPMGLPLDEVVVDGKKVRLCSTDSEGLVRWRDSSVDPPSPYKVDGDGYLLNADGKRMYSDYDLENVYDSNGQVVSFEPKDPGGMGNQIELDEALQGPVSPNDRLIQHSANGQYKKPDGSMGNPPKANEEYVVIDPNTGTAKEFDSPDALNDWLQSQNPPISLPYEGY